MPESAPPSRKGRSIPSFSEGISSPKGQSSEDGKIRAPCMIRGVCAAKRVPSWQDIHVVYPPTAICRAFRIHGAHILPKPAHFEYTAAIYCHEGALFPSEAFFGIHRGKILPSSDIRERITSTYRHRQALGNAFRGHLAVAERPKSALRAHVAMRWPPGNTIRGHMPPCPTAR